MSAVPANDLVREDQTVVDDSDDSDREIDAASQDTVKSELTVKTPNQEVRHKSCCCSLKTEAHILFKAANGSRSEELKKKTLQCPS